MTTQAAKSNTIPTHTGRFETLLAIVIGVLVIVLQAGTIFFLQQVRAYLNTDGGDKFDLLIPVIDSLAVLLMSSFGLLIVLRSASRSYGWLMLATGFSFTLGEFTSVYGPYALLIAPDKNLPLGLLAGWLQDMYMPVLVLIFSLVILFPDGNLPRRRDNGTDQVKSSRRWRNFFGLFIGGWSLLALTWAFLQRDLLNGFNVFETKVQNPLGIMPATDSIGNFLQRLFVVMVPFSVGLGIANLYVRWRHSSGEVRQQIKWVLYFFLLMVLLVLVSSLYEILFIEVTGIDLGLGSYLSVAVSLSLMGVMMSLGVAVLKFRLYDIDLIINRTLVYGALTGTLALIYYGSVLLLQQVFTAESPIAIVLSTLAIAALFSPLRRRIQEGIDRRFYRSKYDAQRTLETFSALLRDEVDLEQISESLLETVDEALHPEHASLWLKKIDHLDKISS